MEQQRSTTQDTEAAAVAARAAARAGVRIDAASSMDDLRAAADLWRTVWNPDAEPPVNAELLRAHVHAGAYVSLGRSDGRPVAALLGFFAAGRGGVVDHLHSHILAVDASMRGRGVGLAMKLHQRAWALARGLDRITWTYDPLVRANGHFNIMALGAEGAAYLPDFYGRMDDAINRADPTDRVLVEWDLRGSRARAAAAGSREHPPGADTLIDALHVDAHGIPVPNGAAPGPLRCPTPADVVALRRDDPGRALEWRAAVREVLLPAFEHGCRITGMTGGGDYVVTAAHREGRALLAG